MLTRLLCSEAQTDPACLYSCCCCAGPAIMAQQMDVETLLRVGRQALAQGKIDQALPILSAATAKFPADPRTWFALAGLQINQGRKDLAALCFQKAAGLAAASGNTLIKETAADNALLASASLLPRDLLPSITSATTSLPWALALAHMAQHLTRTGQLAVVVGGVGVQAVQLASLCQGNSHRPACAGPTSGGADCGAGSDSQAGPRPVWHVISSHMDQLTSTLASQLAAVNDVGAHVTVMEGRDLAMQIAAWHAQASGGDGGAGAGQAGHVTSGSQEKDAGGAAEAGAEGGGGGGGGGGSGDGSAGGGAARLLVCPGACTAQLDLQLLRSCIAQMLGASSSTSSSAGRDGAHPISLDVCPGRVVVRCVLVESQELVDMNEVRLDHMVEDTGLDYGPCNELLWRPSRSLSVDSLQYRPLSRPCDLLSVSTADLVDELSGACDARDTPTGTDAQSSARGEGLHTSSAAPPLQPTPPSPDSAGAAPPEPSLAAPSSEATAPPDSRARGGPHGALPSSEATAQPDSRARGGPHGAAPSSEATAQPGSRARGGPHGAALPHRPWTVDVTCSQPGHLDCVVAWVEYELTPGVWLSYARSRRMQRGGAGTREEADAAGALAGSAGKGEQVEGEDEGTECRQRAVLQPHVWQRVHYLPFRPQVRSGQKLQFQVTLTGNDLRLELDEDCLTTATTDPCAPHAPPDGASQLDADVDGQGALGGLAGMPAGDPLDAEDSSSSSSSGGDGGSSSSSASGDGHGGAAAAAGLILPYHMCMLNDRQRTTKYRDGIAGAVRRALSDHSSGGGGSGLPWVLDVGAGTGLLSMISAQAGCKAVIGVERELSLAMACASLAAANGLDGSAICLHTPCNRLTLQPQAPDSVEGTLQGAQQGMQQSAQQDIQQGTQGNAATGQQGAQQATQQGAQQATQHGAQHSTQQGAQLGVPQDTQQGTQGGSAAGQQGPGCEEDATAGPVALLVPRPESQGGGVMLASAPHLVVHEVFGSDPLSEHILSTMRHVKAQLCSPYTRFMPASFRVVAALAWTGLLYRARCSTAQDQGITSDRSITTQETIPNCATTQGATTVPSQGGQLINLGPLAPWTNLRVRLGSERVAGACAGYRVLGAQVECNLLSVSDLVLLTHPTHVMEFDLDAPQPPALQGAATVRLDPCPPTPVRHYAQHGACLHGELPHEQLDDGDDVTAGAARLPVQPAAARPSVPRRPNCAVYWFEADCGNGGWLSTGPGHTCYAHWSQCVDFGAVPPRSAEVVALGPAASSVQLEALRLGGEGDATALLAGGGGGDGGVPDSYLVAASWAVDRVRLRLLPQGSP